MFSNILIQAGLFLTVLLIVTKPMGLWLAGVMNGDCKALNKIGGPFERLIYHTLGVTIEKEMHRKQYAAALIVFNVLGIAIVYVLQRWQVWLPLNPQNLPAVSVDSPLNTAISL